MLKEPKTPLGEGQGGLSTDSVYDFLYYDARRIGSFLSQFDDSGHLKEMIQKESVSRSKEGSTTVKAEGGVPLVANVDAEFSKRSSAADQQESQRVYDPLWANARAFLDYLSERGLIQRNISEAHMGQFVLCSGNLSITDLNLMEKIWKLKSIKSLIRGGNHQQLPENRKKRRASGKSVASTSSPELELIIELLSVLPHTIQAKISGSANAWCNLSQDDMSTLASDIALKHGTNIPGEWHALGIMDARPDAPDAPEVDFSDDQEIVAKLNATIAPVARDLLERPEDHFGITPLLIFREVPSE